jgi:hypothetical protein
MIKNIELAEVISRIAQAVLGDLIPMPQSYNMPAKHFETGRFRRSA